MNSSIPLTGTPSVRIVVGGSSAPTFWSFLFGHDSLSPVEQQRLLHVFTVKFFKHKHISQQFGGHLSAWSWSEIRWWHRQYKQNQWSDNVQVFILNVAKLAATQQQFWMKECDIFRGGGGSKYTLTPYIFSGGSGPPNLPGSTPLHTELSLSGRLTK